MWGTAQGYHDLQEEAADFESEEDRGYDEAAELVLSRHSANLLGKAVKQLLGLRKPFGCCPCVFLQRCPDEECQQLINATLLGVDAEQKCGECQEEKEGKSWGQVCKFSAKGETGEELAESLAAHISAMNDMAHKWLQENFAEIRERVREQAEFRRRGREKWRCRG